MTDITLEALALAFDHAETDTARHFNQQTCSLKNEHGEDECPICYFRRRVKDYLGVNQEETAKEGN